MSALGGIFMGKYLGVIFGALSITAGVLLVYICGNEVLVVLKGLLPGFLIFIGILCAIAGYSEFSDYFKEKNK
jgi:hypothetical protein